MAAESCRVHHLDVAPRRRGSDAARGGVQVAHAGECGQKDVMVARVVRDQNYPLDGACRIGMLLERRIPKILGKVLLTNGKAAGGSASVARKREREADLDGRAVRPFAFALEAHGIRDADPRLPKARRVRRGVIAFENHQRKPLLILQKASIEGAEECRETVAS